MSKNIEIFNFLKGLLLNFLDMPEDDIMPETTIASLGMESLDFIELQVEFEKAYRLKIRPTLFASGQVATIAQFVAHVEGLLKVATVSESATPITAQPVIAAE